MSNQELLIHYFLKACKENNVEKIMTIYEYENFDINSTDKYGNSGLHIASYHGNLDVVKCLVGLKANVNIRNNKGDTPIMFCCGSPTKKEIKEDYNNSEYFIL
jgi:ankyrin repeat protein